MARDDSQNMNEYELKIMHKQRIKEACEMIADLKAENKDLLRQLGEMQSRLRIMELELKQNQVSTVRLPLGTIKL